MAASLPCAGCGFASQMAPQAPPPHCCSPVTPETAAHPRCSMAAGCSLRITFMYAVFSFNNDWCSICAFWVGSGGVQQHRCAAKYRKTARLSLAVVDRKSWVPHLLMAAPTHPSVNRIRTYEGLVAVSIALGSRTGGYGSVLARASAVPKWSRNSTGRSRCTPRAAR